MIIDKENLHFDLKEGYLAILGKCDQNTISTAHKIMKSRGLKTLKLPDFSSKSVDISFLYDFEFIEEIDIRAGVIFEPLYYLKNLRKLTLDSPYKGLADFTKFHFLKDIAIDGRSLGIESIKFCDIETFCISKFQEISLNILKDLNNLKFLSISDSDSLINLSGIENLKKIERLIISNCKALKDISAIYGIENVKEIDLYGCPNIESFEPLKYLIKLKRINLEKIGNISSISFMDDLIELKEFYFDKKTNIVDGDLSVLKRLINNGSLKKVIFPKKKHYNLSKEDLGYKQSDYLKRIFGKQ